MDRRQVIAAVVAAGIVSAGHVSADVRKPMGKAPTAELKTARCMGGNARKGRSECGAPGAHTCHTRSACKGKGWVMVASEKECEDLEAEDAEPAAPKKS